VKAASQQRRTLSFKDGLLEIKKSMGMGAGQPPEEQAQKTQGKPAQKGAKTHGTPHAQKGLRAPREGAAAAGAGEARSRSRQGRPQGARPQQQTEQSGKSDPAQRAQQQRRQQGPKPARGPEAAERPAQQRRRPARPQQPAANLSEAEKARIERNRQLNTVWNVFAKHYPAFRDRLPLKIGVAEDLVARHPEYDRTLIVAVLKRHVNHPRYHERVAAGGSRYELDGTASEGPGIEPSHIGRANAALARQKAKAEAQAKAREEGKAQPEAPTQAAEAPPQAAEATAHQAAEQAEPQLPQPQAPAQSAEADAGVQQPENGETPVTGA